MRRRSCLILILTINILILLLAGCGMNQETMVFSEDTANASISQDTLALDNAASSFDEASGKGDMAADNATVFVHISGAVNNPGVYELNMGSRLCDAIRLAGGFKEGACEDYCNQALILEDANQYFIPTIEEAAAMTASLGQDNENRFESHYDSQGKLDINQASIEELMGLNGIGEARANAIVAYRQDQGPFKSIEDIKNVSGIKDALFSQIRDYIIVR